MAPTTRRRLLPPTFGRKVMHLGIPRSSSKGKMMRLLMRFPCISAACGMLVLSVCAPAGAVNCYQIWDARDTLVYQSTFPPFDLAGPAFDRAMANLRSQRRTFIFFDTRDCALTGSSLTGPESVASSDPSSLLDIRSATSGRSGGGMLSPTPATAGAAAPAGAPPQAGANSRPSTPAGGSRTSFFY